MFRTAFKLIFATAAALVLPACNTDPLWTKNQDPQGPVMRDMTSPDHIQLPDIRIAEAHEVDLVEQVLMHRAMYKKSLLALRMYYKDSGYQNKQEWADYELADVNRIKPFKYILSAEIPAPNLRPSEHIPEADKLYSRGLELMKKGGHGLPVLYREDMMRDALKIFTELITKYPRSDKIDDAAFCCGEIYKEYFKKQERIALKWYERSFTWDPSTPHPSRFQSAVVYDYRLHDRARALEMYHAVLSSEPRNKSNTAFATRRIYELTEGMKQLAEPRDAEPVGLASTGQERFGHQTPDVPRQAQPAPNADLDDQVAAEELIPVADLGDDD